MTRYNVDFSQMQQPHKPAQYTVSALLRGHTDDVRALACDPLGRLYSASRDNTVRQWTRRTSINDDDSAEHAWQQTDIWQHHHEGFVNSVAWLPSQENDDYLVTGGQDAIIQVHQLSSNGSSPTSDEAQPPPAQTLLGHLGNVCCLHGSANGKRLVSGSWDYTARVWSASTWETEHVLTHEAAVWDVLAVDVPKFRDCCVTACADGLVRLFRGSKVVTNFKGHQGPVRALAKIMPDDADSHLFASASNDGSIRIWSFEGHAVTVLDGHPDSFIYSLSSIPTVAGGGLASSGEEGIVKVWNDEDGEQDQELLVPALSVWNVLALGNGDLACACSDDLVWVFSRQAGQAALETTRTEYDRMLAARQKPIERSASISAKTALAVETALDKPGKHDGEIRVAASELDDSAHAFRWSSSSETWLDIGQVIEPNEISPRSKPTSRMEHEGVEYDFVFSIDIADDQAPIKLPYNVGQDPHQVATDFVAEHKLPVSYVDQIVQFIRAATR
ncbi:hypothetical protein ACM66B_005179 [Microbotryomycetes sp. NB124-2]